jgi:hypothetical protein
MTMSTPFIADGEVVEPHRLAPPLGRQLHRPLVGPVGHDRAAHALARRHSSVTSLISPAPRIIARRPASDPKIFLASSTAAEEMEAAPSPRSVSLRTRPPTRAPSGRAGSAWCRPPARGRWCTRAPAGTPRGPAPGSAARPAPWSRAPRSRGRGARPACGPGARRGGARPLRPASIRRSSSERTARRRGTGRPSGEVQLGPVAGREEHRLVGVARCRPSPPRSERGLGAPEGEPLPHLDGGRRWLRPTTARGIVRCGLHFVVLPGDRAVEELLVTSGTRTRGACLVRPGQRPRTSSRSAPQAPAAAPAPACHDPLEPLAQPAGEQRRGAAGGQRQRHLPLADRRGDLEGRGGRVVDHVDPDRPAPPPPAPPPR